MRGRERADYGVTLDVDLTSAHERGSGNARHRLLHAPYRGIRLAGASIPGFRVLGQQAAPEELELARRAVASGDVYLSPAVSGMPYNRFTRKPSMLDRLTARQREVLQLVAEGQTSPEIAPTLRVGLKTVESHRTQLIKTLDIHDVAGLVRYAVRAGLVPAE